MIPLVRAARALSKSLARLRFGAPAAYVLDPTIYARPVHEAYLERFGGGPKEYVLLGMNPGPYGMAQTGVPFGEVTAVRDYLQLHGVVRSPRAAPPARPILGFDCSRSEVSGRRLWGAIAARHPRPESFFARAFVANYCPLLFLDEKLANLVPDRLRRPEREALQSACDEHLRAVAACLAPRMWIAVGRYAQACIGRALGTTAVLLPHPSPASPAANRDWSGSARAALHEAGIADVL